MKKTILSIVLALGLVMVGQAQFIISDFSDLANDFGPGQTSISGFTSSTQNASTWTGTGPAIGSQIAWAFTGTFTEIDLSAFNQLEFAGTVTGTTAIIIDFVDDTFNFAAPVASATFTVLDGSLVTQSITGSLTGVAGAALSAGGTGTWTGTLDQLALVPEPSSFALMGLGMGALYLLRRRK